MHVHGICVGGFEECDQHGRIKPRGQAVIRLLLGGLSPGQSQNPGSVCSRVSSVCVWVWKRLATPGVAVPGHSVWMEVIASGGQPATETQCFAVRISVLSLFTMTEYYIFFPLPCT